MDNNFNFFIKNNFSIIETMFHIKEKDVKIIDNYNRTIIKNYNIDRLFIYIPIIKTCVEELLKDLKDFNIIINETYNDSNKTFTYRIFFDIEIDNLKDVEAFIFLSQDKNDNRKINVSVSTNKDSELVSIFIMNHYKNNHLENELKPLIANLSRHSLELNII